MSFVGFCATDDRVPMFGLDNDILILAASGTSVVKFARHIHDASSRRDHPFQHLSYEGWPVSLIESELFGHVRGAFLGAFRDYDGALARTRGGTLFVEGLDHMPPSIVSRLLRATELGRATRLGAPSIEHPVDVRIIATAATLTNVGLVHNRFQVVEMCGGERPFTDVRACQ